MHTKQCNKQWRIISFSQNSVLVIIRNCRPSIRHDIEPLRIRAKFTLNEMVARRDFCGNVGRGITANYSFVVIQRWLSRGRVFRFKPNPTGFLPLSPLHGENVFWVAIGYCTTANKMPTPLQHSMHFTNEWHANIYNQTTQFIVYMYDCI